MTPLEAFADGRLADAVAAQEAVVSADPGDHAARLFLVELLVFTGRLRDAWSHLALIDSDDPNWPAEARGYRRLLKAEHRRLRRRPRIVPDPVPPHASRRWRAIRAIRDADPDGAVKLIDRADRAAPDLTGFIDGQEFAGLRDADERFASVLEAVAGGECFWFPWEKIRRVKLHPAKYTLDRYFRPAEVGLRGGADIAVHLPLIYPESHAAGDEFAIGLGTDHVCPDGGPTRCVGGKLLLVGDDEEVPLADCRMIEIR